MQQLPSYLFQHPRVCVRVAAPLLCTGFLYRNRNHDVQQVLVPCVSLYIYIYGCVCMYVCSECMCVCMYANIAVCILRLQTAQSGSYAHIFVSHRWYPLGTWSSGFRPLWSLSGLKTADNSPTQVRVLLVKSLRLGALLKPIGSMHSCMIYFGLKLLSIWVLWGLSI